jgi:hypothetical protein
VHLQKKRRKGSEENQQIFTTNAIGNWQLTPPLLSTAACNAWGCLTRNLQTYARFIPRNIDKKKPYAMFTPRNLQHGKGKGKGKSGQTPAPAGGKEK